MAPLPGRSIVSQSNCVVKLNQDAISVYGGSLPAVCETIVTAQIADFRPLREVDPSSWGSSLTGRVFD